MIPLAGRGQRQWGQYSGGRGGRDGRGGGRGRSGGRGRGGFIPVGQASITHVRVPEASCWGNMQQGGCELERTMIFVLVALYFRAQEVWVLGKVAGVVTKLRSGVVQMAKAVSMGVA